MTPTHPVAAALRERPDDARLALVVEGGGMRGAVSGGMALALHELGLAGAFDAAYGSSAGALNAMWLVSGRAGRDRAASDRDRRRDRRRRRPAPADPRRAHAAASPAGLGDAAAARRPAGRARRAPAAGRRAERGDPVRAALADGATHVLVLRSRREGETAAPPSPRTARAMERLLGRIDAAVARAFLGRAEREAEDEALLALHARDPERRPHILSVRPAPGSPVPARLERDIDVVRGGLEAGRAAVHALLAR